MGQMFPSVSIRARAVFHGGNQTRRHSNDTTARHGHARMCLETPHQINRARKQRE